MARRVGLRKLEVKALKHFAESGICESPHGVGSVTLFNLLQHGWIERTERSADYAPETYKITDKGKSALATAVGDQISN